MQLRCWQVLRLIRWSKSRSLTLAVRRRKGLWFARRYKLLRLVPLLTTAVSAQTDLPSVIAALRAHDYQQALTLAKELDKSTSGDPRLPFLEGMANEGLNHKLEALRYYRAALKIKPDFLPALKAEAQIEYADGAPSASNTVERIVKLDPTDQVSHAMLAALSYKAGNCGLAVTHYRQSEAVISTKPDALTQYGECLLRQNQPDDAVAALTEAAVLEPGQWWSHYNLAAAELSRKKPQAAIKALEPLLRTEEVQPQVLDLAAAAYEASGNTPKAVELLRGAILGAPDNESYYLHFANLSFDHQSFQVGVDMINAGLTRLPKSARLYLARGILFGQLGDFARAESDFDKADQFSGGEAIAGAATSLAELQNSNLDKALQLSRAKLKSTPQDPMLNYVRAETLKQMGVAPGSPEFREALQSASTAVRLKPDFAAARNLLGSLYMQEGKLQLATEQFTAVLKQDSADQTALYHLLQIARRSGKSEDVPRLMRELAQAKTVQRQRDQATGQYRLIETQSDK